eukprot:TRINITY_DN1941_c0_g1_i1.p1 TRINITY_DN1941_c0_g1~~TRINITY_DN1941_c0_g1_i1.p1  ORF type:complete len:184 (+),score=18.88 TRINITY_DN1941_c0_g1_i1:155-706(+)
MNLLNLLKSTLSLGWWGVVTLYYMAFNMALGLFAVLYPSLVASFFLSPSFFDEVPVVEGVAAATAVVPSVAIHFVRFFGAHVLPIGALFRLLGSVTDPKARRRVAIFCILYSVIQMVATLVFLTVKATRGMFQPQPLAIVAGLHFIGVILSTIMIFVNPTVPSSEGSRPAKISSDPKKATKSE